MITNQQVWGKTLLSSYNYLERLCESIDNVVEKTAVNSYYTGFFGGGDTVEEVSKKIIEYSNRKIGYINLKLIIERTLKSLPKDYAKLLILKFIQKIDMDRICELLKLKIRSSYRRIELAVKAFSEKLEQFGYTKEKLDLEYLGDPFMCSILKLVQKNNCVLEEKAEVITSGSVYGGYLTKLLESLG